MGSLSRSKSDYRFVQVRASFVRNSSAVQHEASENNYFDRLYRDLLDDHGQC